MQRSAEPAHRSSTARRTRSLAVVGALTILAAVLVPVAHADAPRPTQTETPSSTSFGAWDVMIHTGNVPLAAYQISIQATAGDVRIVGIEGGEPDPFRDAPYYDPAAMQNEHVIIADFTNAPRRVLPRGPPRSTRIPVPPLSPPLPAVGRLPLVAATLGQGGNRRAIQVAVGVGAGEAGGLHRFATVLEVAPPLLRNAGGVLPPGILQRLDVTERVGIHGGRGRVADPVADSRGERDADGGGSTP